MSDLVMNMSAGTQIFGGGVLGVYRTYNFQIQVNSLLTGKNASDSIFISVIEVPIPEFFPILSRQTLLSQEISMDQENLVEVEVGGSKNLVYSAAIIYNHSQVIQSIDIGYHQLRFKVWDYLNFEEIEQMNYQVSLRVSIYDQSFLSSASILFNYRVRSIVGRGGYLRVSPPNTGLAYTQLFQISV
jgi:hypothetical protein